jgi:hypothetical protein
MAVQDHSSRAAGRLWRRRNRWTVCDEEAAFRPTAAASIAVKEGHAVEIRHQRMTWQ